MTKTTPSKQGLIFIPCFIFLLGCGLSFWLGDTLQKSAHQSWKSSAERTAHGLSGIFLNWLEESYAPVSALMTLVENSEEVTEDEFLDAYDSLESRAVAFFLDGAALLRFKDGSWTQEITTEPLEGWLSEGSSLEIPAVKMALDMARSRRGQVILAPTFSDLDSVPHFPVALLSRNKGHDVCILGWLNHHLMMEGLFATHVPVGMSLDLDGRFGPSLENKTVILKENAPDALASFITRAMSGSAELHLTWNTKPNFDGGPDETMALMAKGMGTGLSLLLSLLLFILIRNNQVIKTKVKLATHELRENQNRLRTILDNVPSIVLLKDREGTHQEVNSFYEKARGVKSKDILGKKDSDVLSPELAKKIMERDREIMDSKTIQTYQEEVHHLDGSIHLYMMTKVPLMDEKGEVTGLCGLGTDISEIQKAKTAIEKNEERFRSLTNNVQGVIYRCKMDQRYTMKYLNPYFENLTGYRVEDCLGEANSISFADIIHPEDRERVWKEIHEAIENNESYSMQYRITHRDGQIRHVFEQGHASFEHQQNQNGKAPDYIDGFIVDVTDRKKVEVELQNSRALMQSLFDSIPDLIFAKDVEGVYQQTNASFDHLVGQPKDKIIGKTDHGLSNSEVSNLFQGDDNEMMNQGTANSREDWVTYPDGKKVMLDTLKTPFYSNEGTLLGILGISRDITERKKYEEVLAEAKEKAETATKAKGDFLANMSHEIRTPMNAIIGLSHLALTTELNRKQKDYLSKISSAANNLLGIINDILDFSKIEAGKLDMENISFDLSDTMDNLSNIVALKASEKELELIVDLQPDVPLNLIGDPLRLNQVLINLTNNAVKFTEIGEIEIKIEVESLEKDKVNLNFIVRDSGIGMNDEQIKRLFQAFSQADTSTTRKFGGTGLGLTISKSLVEMMGGDIGVSSKPGEGSTFFFNASFGIASDMPKRKVPVIPSELNHLRILVVDDNSTSRTIFVRYLKTFNFEADEANSGEDAIVKIKDAKDSYDLILMDWKMPGMNGLETIREINENPAILTKPKVIMASAYSKKELPDEAALLGVESFLVKPVSPSTLLDAIFETFDYEVEQTTVHLPIDQQAHHFNGSHFLLVEDNDINQQVATEILADQGITVTIAGNGQLGVDTLLKDPDAYEVVLMDIQMPIMDGYSATKVIRQNPQFDQLPIIAMTANAMAGDRERALEAGMNDHVAKPIDINNLFTVLSKYVKPKETSSAPLNSTIESEANIPELEGIQIDNGLAVVGGKKNLYLKILRKFKQQEADTVIKIREALSTQDQETALREAHTLKGLAGNIGALDLQKLAAEVEQALKNHQVTDEQLNHLEKELLKITTAIAILGEEEIEQSEVKNIENLQEGLDKLISLLDDDDAASIEQLEEIKSALPHDLVRKMTQSMEEYDFEEALEVLQDWNSKKTS